MPGWALVGLAGLLLFLLAALPRLSLPGRVVTADEDTWVGLTGNFAAALSRGRLERTYQIGHPGVTALWTSLAGMGLERAQRYAGLVAYDDRVSTRRAAAREPSLVDDLNAARTAHALANALLVAICGLLALRLAGPLAGLLTGGLLALDPFLVAHAQVIRMDSLQAGLLGVGLLALLIRWTAGGRPVYLLLGGVALGLALLSKTSSAVIAGPLLLCAGWRGWRLARTGPGPGRALVSTIGELGVLGAVALATALAGWPALWVAPLETVQRMIDYTAFNGGNPPESGNFFLGRPIPDPGPAFYPLTLAFRLTPLAIAGLAALGLAWRARRSTGGARAALPWLLLTVACFFLALTPAPKKADRYLLPIWPPLLALAGIGLAGLIGWPRAGWRWRTLAVGALLAAQLVWLPPVATYALSYYNPLLGGPSAARGAMPVGWGEGLERAAAFLNDRAGGDEVVTTTLYSEPLRANLDGISLPLGRFAEADVLVHYVNMEQRQLLPPELQRHVEATLPLWSYELDGVSLVRIYPLPPTEFGGALQVERITLDDDQAEGGERVLATIRWRPLAAQASGWRPRLALLDPAGREVASSMAEQPARTGRGQSAALRLRLPRERGRYRAALTVLDERGQPIEPTATPPWSERASQTVVLPTISVRVR